MRSRYPQHPHKLCLVIEWRGHATQLLSKVYGDVEDTDFSFSVDLPNGIELEDAERLQQQIGKGVEALRKHHHSLTLKLAAKLLLTELQLYQQARD